MPWPFRSRRSSDAPTQDTGDPQALGATGSAVPPRRIAVLGAAGFDVTAAGTIVRCFPWTYHGTASEVADFDVAIVNLAGAEVRESFPGGPALPTDIDGAIVSALLTAARRLIDAGGEVVVVGRPDTYYWGAGGPGHGPGWTVQVEWTGLRLNWDEHTGDRIERTEDETPFAPYLARVKRYEYSLTGAIGAELYRPTGHPMDPWGGLPRAVARMEVVTQQLLWTRHRGLVASVHSVWSPLEGPGRQPARVVLLPPLTEGGDESVTVILRDVYGVPVASPDAPWLTTIAAPGEQAVQAQIEAVNDQIAALEDTLRQLEVERATLRRALRLLSQGGPELEVEVRDAFRRLGADVEDPTEPNKEDGWIVVRLPGVTLHGVLEIKSTQKTAFDEGGLRQLQEWKARGTGKRGVAYKGLFIGNSAYGLAPDARPDPFGTNFRRTAASNDLVALTTTVLLAELTQVVDQGTAADNFWRKLFATRGVYE